MLTLTFLLAITAFLTAIASAMGYAPLWLPVILLCLLELLRVVPR